MRDCCQVTGRPLVAAAQPPDQVPDQVAVQQPSPLGVGLGLDQPGQERLEPDHFLVAPGQGADGDERLPQMGQGPARGQARRGPGGSAGCGRRRGRPARGRWTGLVSQRIAVPGCSAVASSRRRACSPGGRSRPEGPSARPGAGRSGSGRTGRGSGGRGRCRPGSRARPGARCSQRRAGRPGCRRRSPRRGRSAEQAAVRRWQAGHQGWPVAREMPHGVIWPQMEQVSSGSVQAARSTAARPGSAAGPGGGARSRCRSPGSPGR